MQLQSPTRRPFTFDRVTRIIITTIGILIALWLIDRLSPVLLPFLVAWVIAYLLEPMVQRNRHALRLKGRLVAIIITLGEVLVVGCTLIYIFLPSLINEMHQMASVLRQYAANGTTAAFVPESIHQFLRDHIDFEHLSEKLTREDYRQLLEYVGAFLSGGMSVIMGVVNAFMVLLYLIFIMLDYDKLIHGFKKMVPPRYARMVFGLAHDMKESMNHYFRGQSTVAFIVGILFAIGFLIVGLPLGVLLGLIIGVLNLVPYLQLISLVPTTILCLVYSVQDNISFWTIWLECMAVYIIVQAIQDLYLTPKIMGKAMGLNPAIILLSLSVWGSLLGFIGLIIALPLTTLMLSYYNKYILHNGTLPTYLEAQQ